MFSFLLPIIYIAFISLGLPDALLGAAWPSIYPVFQVPVSYAGIISMIISGMTIISSLQSDRLTFRYGTGKVTAVSVAVTAAALFGFSISHSFLALCLWAIPYGLGAGNVDASLNNYVALHYESRHMSWLHCMWGLGATMGPYVMGFALSGGYGWNMGYRIIGMLQIVLTAVLLFSLPMWKERTGGNIEVGRETETGRNIEVGRETETGRNIEVGRETEAGGNIEVGRKTEIDRKIEAGRRTEAGGTITRNTDQNEDSKLGEYEFGDSIQEKEKGKSVECIQKKPLTLKEIVAIPGAKPIMICFLCYCGLEQTAGLWAASYLHLYKGIDAETAAGFAALFFIGITVGRALSGFITMKLNDNQMIYLGLGIISIGISTLILPGPEWLALAGLIMIGLGCAPVYPCIIHSTPDRFGSDKSQAIIGVQMASAYVGSMGVPPLFGLVANHISIGLLPVYLFAVLALMFTMFYMLNHRS